MEQVRDEDFHTNSEDILKELQAEGNEIEGETVQPQEEETPEEPEAPSQQEPEVPETTEEEVETQPEVIDRVPKEPTLIPAWKAKIAEDRLAKENESLRQQIEEFQKKPTMENMENVRDLAQSYGIELDESQEKFFNALVSTVKQNAVPQDLVKNLEALQQQKQIDYLETQYAQEFTKDVAPLIKERYGDLPDKELATLQKKLHDIAFTEAYAKVPLKKIFLAESDDLNVKAPKQSIVTHKGGKTRGTELDLSNVDEDTFTTLDGDTLDRFIEQKSGQSQWSRR